SLFHFLFSNFHFLSQATPPPCAPAPDAAPLHATLSSDSPPAPQTGIPQYPPGLPASPLFPKRGSAVPRWSSPFRPSSLQNARPTTPPLRQSPCCPAAPGFHRLRARHRERASSRRRRARRRFLLANPPRWQSRLRCRIHRSLRPVTAPFAASPSRVP